MVYKSKTGTSADQVTQTVTITSPNTKMIFLKQYLVAAAGTVEPTTTITIQIVDEDDNVLWEDAILCSLENDSTGPFRVDHTFPGRGLSCPMGKNMKIVVGDPGGAGSHTECSVLYSI